MRWHLLIPLALLIGFLPLGWIRLTGTIPNPAGQPEWLLLLAFHTALHAPRGYALPAFWVCGLVHDLLLGHRPGATLLLFCLLAGVTALLRDRVRREHWLTRIGLVFLFALAVQFARPLLEQRSLAGLLDPAMLRHAGWAALWTALASPVLRLVLEETWLRTWVRDDDPFARNPFADPAA